MRQVLKREVGSNLPVKKHCVYRRYVYLIQQSNKKATPINRNYRRSLWRTSITKLSEDEYFSMINTQFFIYLKEWTLFSLKKKTGTQIDQWMSAEVIKYALSNDSVVKCHLIVLGWTVHGKTWGLVFNLVWSHRSVKTIPLNLLNWLHSNAHTLYIW